MNKDLTLPFDKVRHLFDLVVGSLDFGSGFLDDEDVDLLREVARWLDVNPDVATPYQWRHKYPHPMQWSGRGQPQFDYLRASYPSCQHCGRPEQMPCHQESA